MPGGNSGSFFDLCANTAVAKAFPATAPPMTYLPKARLVTGLFMVCLSPKLFVNGYSSIVNRQSPDFGHDLFFRQNAIGRFGFGKDPRDQVRVRWDFTFF